MRYIEVSGTPFQRGFRHGRELKEQIGAAIEFAERASWLQETRTQRGALLLENMSHWLLRKFPSLVEEMEGIAEGASVESDIIERLNMAYAVLSIVSATETDRCTNFGITGSPWGPIHGKTIDVLDDYVLYVLQRVEPVNGHPFLGAGWAGTVWMEIGMNDAGLSCGTSSAPAAPHQDGMGVPQHMLPRAVMEHCSTVPQTLEFLANNVMAGNGLNFMIADADGSLAAVEKSHDKQAVLSPQGGYLFVTNHFVTREMEGLNRPSSELYLNSLNRYKNLEQIFSVRKSAHTLETMERTLKDHNERGPICQHGPDLYTHFGCLLFPKKKEFWMSDGQPCSATFTRFSV